MDVAVRSVVSTSAAVVKLWNVLLVVCSAVTLSASQNMVYSPVLASSNTPLLEKAHL